MPKVSHRNFCVEHFSSLIYRLHREGPSNNYDHDPLAHGVDADTGVASGLKCKFCSLVCSTEFAYWFHVASAHKMFKNGRCHDCRESLVGPKVWRHHLMVTHAMYRYYRQRCFSILST